MLTIRLQRVGKRNEPFFRLVLAEKHRAAKKKAVEILGHYNPRTKDLGLREERLQYWIKQNIRISPTAHNLLIDKDLIQGAKVKSWKPKRKKAVEPNSPETAEVVDKQP